MMSSLKKRSNYIPPDQGLDMNVAGKVVTGSFWSGISVGANFLVNFVRSMVFARLLMPEDFGLLALANILTQFILLFANFGISASIIYQKKISKKDLSTCWWGNFFIDSVAALVCVIVALINVYIYGDFSVFYIIVLMAIQFIINAIASINLSLLRREFMFKKITIIKMVDAIVTFLSGWFCVSVLNLGVYGLCVGIVCGSLCNAILEFIFMPWIPSFVFSFASFKKHLNYGRWFLGVNIVGFFHINLDRITINAVLDRIQLGFYEYANNIPLLIVDQLSGVLNTVMFAAFSSLQGCHKEVRDLTIKLYRYNSLVIFPFLFGLALVANDFILVVYTEKWMPILVPLRLCCLYGVIKMYSDPFTMLCNGLGKPQLPFKWSLIYLPINAVLIFIGVWYGNIGGAEQCHYHYNDDFFKRDPHGSSSTF